MMQTALTEVANGVAALKEPQLQRPWMSKASQTLELIDSLKAAVKAEMAARK